MEDGEAPAADVEFDDPDADVPIEPGSVLDSDESDAVMREHLDDAASVTTRASKRVATPAGRVTYREEITAAVEADDPLSTSVDCRTDIELTRGSETVELVATGRVTPDFAAATTRVTIEGEPFFDETWTRYRRPGRDGAASARIGDLVGYSPMA